MRPALRRILEDAFLLLCLVGTIPVLIAATMPSGWSAFDAGRLRVGDLLADRFDRARDGARIAEIAQRQRPFDGWPPALPSTAWLETKLAAAAEARDRSEAVVRPYEVARAGLRRQIEGLRRQRRGVTPLDLWGMTAEAVRQREIARLDDSLSVLVATQGGTAARARLDAIAKAADLASAIRLHERWVAEKRGAYRALPYAAVSAALFVFVVWSRGLRHRVALGFVAVAVATSFRSAAARGTDDPLLLSFETLYPVAIAALWAIVLRALFRAVQDNAAIWRLFDRRERRRAAVRALIAWSPFAVVLAVGSWASGRVYDAVAWGIYQSAWVRDSDPARDTLQDDFGAAVDRLYAEFGWRAIDAAGASPDAARTGGVVGLFDRIVPPRVADPQDCRFVDLECHARNIVVGAADRGWQTARDRIRATLQRRLGATTADGFDAAVRDAVGAASARTHRYLDAGFVVASGVSTFWNAVALLIAARALLLILARTLFQTRPRVFAPLSPGETPPEPDRNATVRISAGPCLEIDLGGSVLLVKRTFDVDNAAPETRLVPPQPLNAPFSRIAHRCWSLKAVDGNDDGQPVVIAASEGARFVVWKIPAGGEVAFRWDTFVAISNTATFRKRISLTFGTLVLGHVMLSTVRGPGLLIQKSYGAPTLLPSAVAPPRLLGWNVGSAFRIASSGSFVSLYLDHCQIEPRDAGSAVLDAAREGAAGSGLIAELGRLFRL